MKNLVALILITLLMACSSPSSLTPPHDWAVAQEVRFHNLMTAYAPGPEWVKLYEDTARKVWSLGHHEGKVEDSPYVWPERSVIPTRPMVTSGYRDEFNTVGYRRRLGPHSGVDILAPIGTPVYAVHAGNVHTSEDNARLGGHIKIKNGRGNLSQYMHLDSRVVKKGERVERGQLIGTVGMTGTLSGRVPHLHLAIYHLFARKWRTKEPDFDVLAYPLQPTVL